MGQIHRAFKKNRNGLDWTQHQFIVEATDDLVNFPLGVKTTYRKYSSDHIFTIVPKESIPWRDSVGGLGPQLATDLIPKRMEVRTYPRAEDNLGNRPAGLFVLESIPVGDFGVLPFEPGIRTKLLHVVDWARSAWSRKEHLRGYVTDWVDFAQKRFPKTDDANAYIQSPGNE